MALYKNPEIIIIIINCVLSFFQIQTQADKAFLSRWLKSAKFGDKVVELADSLCHMTGDDQSAMRKQSWDLISLGLSTDANGGKDLVKIM